MSNSALDLNAAIRDLIEVVRTADMDDVELAEQIAAISSVTEDLRPHVYDGMRMQAGLRYENLMADVGARMAEVHEAGDEVDTYALRGVQDPNGFFPYSPIVGGLNPISLPVNMWRADGELGQEIHGEAEFGAAYNGPPDFVHGGVIAATFDELLGCVCVTNGIGGFTGTLTVIYRSPTPLGAPLTMRGWHDRSEGRKVFAKGELYSGDTLCAEAEGIFIRTDKLPSPPGV
jgi:acyl-coenzyme A thioesterase PaaI-like protein